MRDRDRLTLAAAIATVLTSSSLGSVLNLGAWPVAVIGVVALIAGLSILGRRFGLPPLAGPLLGAVGVLLYVTVIFAGSAAVLGVLPGPGALRLLAATVRSGFIDIQGMAPPVPAHGGILLITVGGVALVTLAADLLAATLRRPPLAGLPLLALFAVPAGIAPNGSGVLPFALSVGGYLLLLGADRTDRLARWGRPLRTTAQLGHLDRLAAASYGEEPPTGAMGRRIGLGAICLALVVPVLLPGLREPLFGGNGSAGTGSGSGTGITTYNPIVRLKDQLASSRTQVLLTIRTDETSPTPYLRMAGLDQFDGRTWSQSSLRAGREQRITRDDVLPAAALPGPPATTTVDITKALDARWLPLPYQPTAVRVPGDWRWEGKTGTIFSTRDNARGTSYRVASRRLAPDPDVLDKAQLSAQNAISLSPYLAVPETMPPIIRQEADRIVAKAKAVSNYAKAVAFQKYFRSESFTYSLKVPQGNSDDAIANFLEVRQGFCEQFAATMALFARMEGIPARVAVGFTYGERSGNAYVVTTKDAHAWPELYFPGAGWLPFEPTPVAGRFQAASPAYTQGATSNDSAATGAEGDQPPPKPGTTLNDKHLVGHDQEGSALPLDAVQARERHPWRFSAGGLVAAALLATPYLLRRIRRRQRWAVAVTSADWAHAAWADLRDDARDLRLVWPASASPRGTASWLQAHASLAPPVVTALGRLVTAEEQARYRRNSALTAPSSAAGSEAADLRAAETVVRRALGGQVSAPRRWLARLTPASAIDQLKAAAGRAGAAGDRYERAAARWFRMLLSRRSSAT